MSSRTLQAAYPWKLTTWRVGSLCNRGSFPSPGSFSAARRNAISRASVTIGLLSSAMHPTGEDADLQSIALRGARAFPESITSTLDGTLFIGRLGEGGIVRVSPQTGKTEVFVPSGSSQSRSILGVFADDASKILWACSNDLSESGGSSGGHDHVSLLIGFDLRTGAARRSVALPCP